MADPVTGGTAVGWGMKAVGWSLEMMGETIISKLLIKGFSYVSFNASEKVRQLEIKLEHLQQILGLDEVEITPQRNRLEQLFKDLRSAFYDVEDILDEVEYHRLEEQILSHPDDKLDSDRVKKIQFALFKRFSKKNEGSGISNYKLEKCLKKTEDIINEAHQILPLRNMPSHSNTDNGQNASADSRGVTTATPPPIVIGRDEDCKKIVAMLHQTVESNSGLCYSIIGIHGIPGSGKSTLAQLVCDREKKDRREKKDGHFDLVMWIHVSRNFNVHTIFREMIEAATRNSCPEYQNCDTLEQRLEEVLDGKRFLLVLDDVWYSKDNDASNQQIKKLLSPLTFGLAGSKVLVTSRTADALKYLGAVRCIPMSELGENVFLELFMHYALGGAIVDDQDRRQLESIGAEIAKKLKRSPLAAKTVGAQLHIRPNVEYWRRIGARDILNETMGALWWSYQHLGGQIRRCFAYCSIFPRRHRLERDELINLWVAEGFIKTSNAEQEMEDVAQDYFDELVATSFMQLGGKDYYLIHDLLRDLAEKAAASDCFVIEDGWTGQVPKDVRHLSILTYDRLILTEKIFTLENLRTLIIWKDRKCNFIMDKVIDGIVMKLRKLRVLIVKCRGTDSLSFSVSASIDQLKHLRYLAFQMPYFVKLIFPSTVAKLYHLQTLKFGTCSDLVFSPKEDMINLINLRHVFNKPSQHFSNIGKTRSLQTLQFFTVKKEAGYELPQLKHVNKLRGKLHIIGLENVGSKEEALEAKLADKERLTELVLDWDGEACNPDVQEEVLEALCPPMHLYMLEIRNYHGSWYPNWMMSDGPKYLHELCIYKCKPLGSIPQHIDFFKHLRSLCLWDCSWTAFPDNMERLTSLRILEIFHCRNIRSLPTLPESLQEFVLIDCDIEFTQSCLRTGDPNWQKIEHIPTKRIFRNL